MKEVAEFKVRCPLCRQRFSASSPFAVNETLAAHFAEKHVSLDNVPIRWKHPDPPSDSLDYT